MRERNDEIAIVEYDDRLAAALAKMWCESGEGWNGAVINETEETIRRKEAASSWMNHWLAVSGDEVVGCCSFGRYAFDRDTLYVATLNAHPAWHGKGVGKALVLRAVRETIARGWPRLDLFTWSGNTKALPLYKKCGFMRDHDTLRTHLMNFLPELLESPLGAGVMEGIDWYADNAREIHEGADQYEEDGLRLYRYEWRKGGRFVRAVYEHWGRGLVSLETERFSVKIECDAGKTVFGRGGSFRVVAESAEGVELALEGVADCGVTPALSWKGRVKGRAVVEGGYEVAPIEREQDERRTYPRLAVDVAVDGLSARFAVGRRIAFPVSLSLDRPRKLVAAGADARLALVARDDCPGAVRLEVALDAGPGLALARRDFVAELAPGRRASIPVPAKVVSGGVARVVARAAAIDGDGRTEWTRELEVDVRVPGEARSGRVGNVWLLGAGNLVAMTDLGSSMNVVFIGSPEGVDFGSFGAPEVGKPYSDEFLTTPPAGCDGGVEGSSASARFRLESGSTGLRFERELELSADGTLAQRFRFDPEAASECLLLKCGFDFWSLRETVPYEGLLVTAEIDEEYPWDMDKVDEPWLAGRMAGGMLVAATWEPGARVTISDWQTIVEYDLAALAREGRSVTPALRLHYGTFATIDEVREFALGAVPPPRRSVGPFAWTPGAAPGALALAGEEPVLEPVIPGTAMPVTLRIEGDRGTAWSLAWDADTGHVTPERGALAGPGAELVTVTLEQALDVEKSRALALRADPAGRVETAMRGGEYVVSNGALEFALDPAFSLGVHSLKAAGREWFASEYPARVSRSWYQEWTGGLLCYLAPLYWLGMIGERRESRFFEIRDAAGRRWTGAETRSEVEKDEGLRGLAIACRFATLPGLPLLRYDTRLENRSGRPLDVELLQITYFDAGEGGSLAVDGDGARALKYGTDEGTDEIIDARLFACSSPGTAARLYQYATGGRDFVRREANVDPAILRSDTLRALRLEDGESRSCAPDWIVFDERNLVERDFALFEDIPPFAGE